MIKTIKATINLQNNDDKCFQYAVTVVLNYKNIARDLQKHLLLINVIGKKETFHNIKKLESINKTIALNILFVSYNSQKIRFAYKSKYNLNVKIEYFF